MPGILPLIERLPSLYRPEPDDGRLLTAFLGAVATELDTARAETSMVLPAHWLLHADRAAFDPWFTLRRRRVGLPALVPTDLLDFADAEAFLIAVKDAASPLTDHLRTAFGPLSAELDAWRDVEPAPVALQRRALDALTRIVRGPLLWNAARFQGLAISPQTIARAEANPPGAERTAVNVQLLLEAFPAQLRRAVLDLDFVRDLGRLGAIVPLPPWREPLALRETVEAFRVRLARMVALYRHGLGTVGALRAVVEATLPVDATQPAELRDRPFAIEEFSPLQQVDVQAPTNGPPDGLVGPLMRFAFTNPGLDTVTPTILITGLTPAPGVLATVDPMIESMHAPFTAIGYAGTLAPDATLRLRPTFSTWAIGAAGLTRTHHQPGDGEASSADEEAVAGAPANIVAHFQTSDGMLWAAANGGTRLARFDGSAWSDVASGLASIRCFAQHGPALLIGTADGLLSLPLFPTAPAAPAAVAGFDDVAIRSIVPAHGIGERWIGTDTGLLRWDGVNAPQAVPLGGAANIATQVHAVHLDASGVVHIANQLGAFEYQPARDAWFWYSGRELTEQSPEWLPFGTPTDDTVFLPEVLDVRRGPDASLWFATAQGIARYVARSANGGTFTTLLEAFPDLCAGPVTQIHADARGGVWFSTERGLLRCDGRDWWQRRAGDWVHLGRADVLPGLVARTRGAWRFDRSSGAWQRFESGAGWVVPATELRTSAEPAVTHLIVTEHVVAELGSFDGVEFTHESDVDPADLFLHIKPEEDRIVAGGMPFLPQLRAGTSTWRYLSREPADLVAPPVEARPAWSTEGRLFPPPPSLDAPYSGRFDIEAPPDGHFDQAVFAYDPGARVAFAFEPRQTCAVLVRLQRRPGDAAYDPAVLDRVWEGMQLVRPAGVRTLLAEGETIVRGS